MELVCLNEIADLSYVPLLDGSKELFIRFHVNTVPTRVENRRGRYKNSDAHGSIIPHHMHEAPHGRPSHQRIINEHHPFALDLAMERIELQTHHTGARFVSVLDEGTPFVVIPDQNGRTEPNARRFLVALCREHGGIWHAYEHHILMVWHAYFLRKFLSECFAHAIHVSAKDHGVWPREVNGFEDALLTPKLRLAEPEALDATLVYPDEFSGSNIPHMP